MRPVQNIFQIVIRVAAFYLMLLIVLFGCQRSLLYHPAKEYHSPAAVGLENVEEITLKTEDGLSLTSWYGKSQTSDKTIIFFHGNAGGIANRSGIYKKMLNAGYGLLALEYRGYSGNKGKPAEDGLYKDARAAVKYLLNEKSVTGENIILFGESLGTGVALQMATEFDTAMVVLMAPYSSIAETAQYHYPYIPAKYLVLDKFDSIAKLDKITEPIYIFHGNRDNVIPIEYGRRLYDAISSQKEFFKMDGYGHNNLDIKYIIEKIQEKE